MKTKRLLLAVACLLLLPTMGYAQPADQMQSGISQIDLPADFEVVQIQPVSLDAFQSPAMQQIFREGIRGSVRTFWVGDSTTITAMGFLRDHEFRAAIGFSDEQYQEMEVSLQNALQDLDRSSDFLEMIVAKQAFIESFEQDVDGGAWNRHLEAQERVELLTQQILVDVLDNFLPPEPKQKLQETQLAAMGEMSIFSPSIFEVLNLTDAQREQMEKIKMELEPEFEKYLEIYVEGKMFLENMRLAELEKIPPELRDGAIIRDGSNMHERMERMESAVAAAERAWREAPEFKRISDDIRSSSGTFSTLFRTSMFDVLTDEQWRRFQDLVDNPPRHARIYLESLRGQRGETEENKGDVWVPGSDSWRPGMPIPESYRIRRNTQIRFPRPTNQ